MPTYYVYVIHADAKLADHAFHYVGATDNLLRRLHEHATNRGAKIIANGFNAQGIAWRVSAVYTMQHRCHFLAEKRVKRHRQHSLFCGVCSGDEIKCISGATSVDLDTLGIPLTSAELAAVELPEELPY